MPLELPVRIPSAASGLLGFNTRREATTGAGLRAQHGRQALNARSAFFSSRLMGTCARTSTGPRAGPGTGAETGSLTFTPQHFCGRWEAFDGWLCKKWRRVDFVGSAAQEVAGGGYYLKLHDTQLRALT